MGNILPLSYAIHWLEQLSLYDIRLCGPGTVRLPRVRIDASVTHSERAAGALASSAGLDRRYLTPLAGRPSPNSETEQRVERYLARQPWAEERRWQMLFQPDRLATPMRVDLMFPASRLVVELDGAEHATIAAYCGDRRRDRRLTGAGYRVIRFTNDEVAADLVRVADEIRQFVEARVDA